MQFYNFRIVDYGSDKATSLLRDGQRRRVSLSGDSNQSIGHRRRASSQAQGPAQLPNLSASDSPETGLMTPPKEDLLASQKNKSETNQVRRVGVADTTQTTAPSNSDAVDDLEKSMSALRFVPTSVMIRNSKKT